MSVYKHSMYTDTCISKVNVDVQLRGDVLIIYLALCVCVCVCVCVCEWVFILQR